MLKIDDKITIKSWELSEQFIRASGPGGQNVNKTSSAVELRFEAERSPSLSEPVKKRLKKSQELSGQKMVLLCLNVMKQDIKFATVRLF